MLLGITPGDETHFRTNSSCFQINFYLTRQFTDQILRELLQLISMETRQRLGDRRPQADLGGMDDAIQTQRNDMTAPLTRRGARTRARGDTATIEGDGDVEGTLLCHSLGGHDCPAQMESCQ